MATFVLVHGAFQGGWVWHAVACCLRKENHDVYTPTLTGTGERMHLLDETVDLYTHIQDITNFIYFENLRNVVLVGHCYAGMLLEAVAHKLPRKIAALVYIDGVVPKAGQSFLDLAGQEFQSLLDRHVTGLEVRPLPLSTFGIRNEKDKQWFGSRLVQFPLLAFNSKFPLFNRINRNKSVRKSYIQCTENKSSFIQRTAVQCRRKGWNCYELGTGRSPMVTTPKTLADVLLRIASTSDHSLKDVNRSQDYEEMAPENGALPDSTRSRLARGLCCPSGSTLTMAHPKLSIPPVGL
jgi:hypothetical protein